MASRVWLGDLAIAWRALAQGDDRRRAMVADLLGLTSTMDTPSEIRESDPGIIGPREAVTTYPDPTTPRGQLPTSAHHLQSTAVNDLPLLRPVLYEPAPPITWSVASLSRTQASLLPPPPHHEPLFSHRTAAAIIQALLGQYAADGPLDTAAVVAQLAALRALRSLPRQRRRTLRFGAQILVDRSDTMRLFARDQAELVRLVCGLLGERAEVWHFSPSPLHGVTQPRAGHRQPYRLPASGSVVLLLSDFGSVSHPNSAAGASRWEWEQFFGLIRHHGYALIGLIPYPKGRWPAWLDKQLPLVTWDRGTTASVVNARLR